MAAAWCSGLDAPAPPIIMPGGRPPIIPKGIIMTGNMTCTMLVPACRGKGQGEEHACGRGRELHAARGTPPEREASPSTLLGEPHPYPIETPLTPMCCCCPSMPMCIIGACIMGC